MNCQQKNIIYYKIYPNANNEQQAEKENIKYNIKKRNIHLKIEKSFLFPSLLQDKTQFYYFFDFFGI